MYFLLGISLIFTLLLIVNILSAIAAEVVWRAVSSFLKSSSAQNRSRVIFALSVFPLTAALVFTAAFLVPAYIIFEPPASSEVVSGKLALLALISAAAVGIAAYRVVGSVLSTRRLAAGWLRGADRISVENAAIPVYSIQHPFPVIAVVGTFRPRMFVARQIFESLSPEEFAAAAAHEHGHLAARDNFKRTLMRACRDLVLLPIGRSLERAWTACAESAADEFAARRGGPAAAVDLASALIKIARIAPAGLKPSMPSGSFLMAEEHESISLRVRDLLTLSETGAGAAPAANVSLIFKIVPIALVFAILLLAANQSVLSLVHDALEMIVGVLQ
jgi:Zn-dependent protease with chaperone function